LASERDDVTGRRTSGYVDDAVQDVARWVGRAVSGLGPAGRTAERGRAIPVGRHDTVTGIGLWFGVVGGVLVLSTELFDLNVAVGLAGLALFLSGVVLAGIGAALASRSTGTGWVGSLLRGVRAAVSFAVDLLP
jgi:hypothetical protein